ncbi:MAG: hypothetical protein Q4C91_09490 [Eubacteriales bacterium]|nr:hypothetical protein [Eubacteriales bacterium]
MNTKIRILPAFALSAALICAFPVAGNAASININEPSTSLEAINRDWEEISDKNTFHTFTNGTDKVIVMKYKDYDDLPALSKTSDEYKAVYQTIYCAGDSIYTVAGLAAKAEDIAEVKEIIDSIDYPETASSNPGSSAQTDSDGNSSGTQTDSSASDTEIPPQGFNSIILYDINMNSVHVTCGTDGTGNWYDENGVSYGDLDNVDETAPIYNENGEAYYWNGTFAREAADASSDHTDEDNDSTSDINDPYDLYSWDPGTNSYIPFQKAETDGSPIGRGNGWYYYDTDSESFLPW